MQGLQQKNRRPRPSMSRWSQKDYEDLSNLELLQLLAKEARELELLEQGKVIDAEALD